MIWRRYVKEHVVLDPDFIMGRVVFDANAPGLFNCLLMGTDH